MLTLSKASQLAVILFILIIVSAFAGSYLLNETKESVPQNTYEIAKPHFGPLIKTTAVSLRYEEGYAIGTLPLDNAPFIKNNQSVILYDKNDKILPVGGVVRNVAKTPNNLEVIVTLPKDTKTALLSNNADIIFLETIASKRLPVTAIQENQDGNAFIWKVSTPDEPTSRIEKVYLDNPKLAPPLFDPMDTTILAYHHFILNPDDTLSEDTPIAFETIKIEAPLQNPIKEARRDFEKLMKEKDYARMQFEIENCGKTPVTRNNSSSPSNQNNSSGSCGFDASNFPEELQLFFTLINNPENTGN